jgi:hypothetical protein
MTENRSLVETRLARIRALAPDEDFKPYITALLDSRISAAVDEEPMGVVTSGLLSNQRLLASARYSAENLDSLEKLLSRPEGIVDLGTIEWCLRPALPIRGGKIIPPTSPPWNELTENEISGAASRVCRIDLGFSDNEPFHLGTGFVLGAPKQDTYFVVTNAHVAAEALRSGWPTEKDLSLFCDFDRTSVERAGSLYRLRGSYYIHDKYDLAVLYLSASDDLRFLAGDELRLTSQQPDPTIGAKIGVLGHPHFDSRRDPFPQHFGFGDQYGVKRFSPGLIRVVEERQWLEQKVDVFLHDATTLSGSSGSCILSLQTKEVLGLHFGGWPSSQRSVPTPSGDQLAQLFEANGAVPLWKLANEPFFEQLS